MTIKEIKEYLQEHSARLRELQNSRKRGGDALAELQHRKSQIRASQIGDMPRSGVACGDPLPALLDRERSIAHDLTALDAREYAERGAVERLIARLDKAVERDVLRARYVDRLTWVRVGIAVGYSREQAKRYHGIALQKLSVLIKDVPPCPT